MASNARPEVLIVDDPAAVAEECATRIVESARSKSGEFSVALSGGSTPKAAFALLAGKHLDDVDWAKMALYFGDERCVPPEDADSNFRMATGALFVPLAAAARSPKLIARIEGELDPDLAAQRYAEKLASLPQRDGAPVLDFVMLGMGPDGHTASLFPGSPILQASGSVAATPQAHKGSRRVSLTYATLNAAREIVVMVTGAEKAQSLKLALDGDPHAVPLRDVRPTKGSMIIVCDQAAAAQLG